MIWGFIHTSPITLLIVVMLIARSVRSIQLDYRCPSGQRIFYWIRRAAQDDKLIVGAFSFIYACRPTGAS